MLSGERYPPRRALQRQSKRSTGRIIVRLVSILVDIHSIFIIFFFYNLFPSQRESRLLLFILLSVAFIWFEDTIWKKLKSIVLDVASTRSRLNLLLSLFGCYCCCSFPFIPFRLLFFFWATHGTLRVEGGEAPRKSLNKQVISLGLHSIMRPNTPRLWAAISTPQDAQTPYISPDKKKNERTWNKKKEI